MTERTPLPVFAADPERAGRILVGEGSCFGDHDGSDPECGECNAPVLVDGTLMLCREACREASGGSAAKARLVHRPTSAEVVRRLAAGASVRDLFRHVAGPDPDHPTSRAARSLLYARLRYLSTEKELPVPDLPSLAELVEPPGDSR